MNYPILIFYSQIIVSRMQPRNTFKRVGWGSGEKCRHFFFVFVPATLGKSSRRKKTKKKTLNPNFTDIKQAADSVESHSN